MKPRLVLALVFGLALAAAGYAQDQNSPDNRNSGQSDQSGGPGGQMGPGGGRSGRGGTGMGGGMGMMGRGVAGTVTEAAADHYTVKSFMGGTYTIHFSANTRMLKQPAGGRGGMGGRGGYGGGGGGQRGGNPQQQIKPADIKVGDSISATGEVDASAKSVGAVAIMLLDPARAKEMAQMEADYGKTWLMGRVTSVDGVKVTVSGGPDNADHTFVADENTTFRKRRDPIALTDIQVGDMVRVDGSSKDGVFTAASVDDMGAPGAGRMQRNGPAPQ